MRAKTLTLATPDGEQLAARLRFPNREKAAGVAVLCHPHPAFGGSMDVWLLPRIGLRLAEEGWLVLRFNFRQTVGDGHPAVPDLAAAVTEALHHAEPSARLALVGWSFGALVGLLYGPHDPRVTDWVGIAPPSRQAPEGWPSVPLARVPDDLAAWSARRTVIVGEHDQFYPPADVHLFAPHDVRVIPAADHFFFDRDGEVADLVAAALTSSVVR